MLSAPTLYWLPVFLFSVLDTHLLLTLQTSQDSLPPEDKLTEASENLKHVADTSVPVILNIIGKDVVSPITPCFNS